MPIRDNSKYPVAACDYLKSSSTPELSYDFTAEGGGIVSVSCYNGSTGGNLTCLRPEFQDSAKQCALRCPLGPSIWGRARVRRLEIALEVVSGLGMVGCFFVMILYIANPKLRPFPGWIVIATSFGLFLISWGVFSMSLDAPQAPPSLTRACS